MGNSASSVYTCEFDKESLGDIDSLTNKFQCILDSFTKNEEEFLDDDIKVLLTYVFQQQTILSFLDVVNISNTVKYENKRIIKFYELDLPFDKSESNQNLVNNIKKLILSVAKEEVSVDYFVFKIIDLDIQHGYSLLVDLTTLTILIYNSNYGYSTDTTLDKIRNNIINPLFGPVIRATMSQGPNTDFDILYIDGNQSFDSFCSAYSSNFALIILDEYNKNNYLLNYNNIIKRLDESTPTTMCRLFYKNLYNNFINIKSIISEEKRDLILDFINCYNILYILNNKSNKFYTKNIPLDELEKFNTTFINEKDLTNDFFIDNLFSILLRTYNISDKRIRRILMDLLFNDISDVVKSNCKSIIKIPIQTGITSYMTDIRQFFRDKDTKIKLKKGIVSYNTNKFSKEFVDTIFYQYDKNLFIQQNPGIYNQSFLDRIQIHINESIDIGDKKLRRYQFEKANYKNIQYTKSDLIDKNIILKALIYQYITDNKFKLS